MVRRKSLARPICVTAVSLLLLACSKAPTIEGEVLSKAVRPGGNAIALVTRTEGGALGATVSTGYRVYVEQQGSNAAPWELLRADKSDPPRLKWADYRTLHIMLPCGQIFQFSNFAFVKNQRTHEFEEVLVKLDNQGLCR
jgi:hypothetical protein